MNQPEFYLAVFKSRNHTINFYHELRAHRIKCETVNTPRKLSLGCGLSVKFAASDINRVIPLLRSLNLYSYAGMLSVTQGIQGIVYTPHY